MQDDTPVVPARLDEYDTDSINGAYHVSRKRLIMVALLQLADRDTWIECGPCEWKVRMVPSITPWDEGQKALDAFKAMLAAEDQE